MTLHRNTIIVASELEQRNKQPREHFREQRNTTHDAEFGGNKPSAQPSSKIILI